MGSHLRHDHAGSLVVISRVRFFIVGVFVIGASEVQEEVSDELDILVLVILKEVGHELSVFVLNALAPVSAAPTSITSALLAVIAILTEVPLPIVPIVGVSARVATATGLCLLPPFLSVILRPRAVAKSSFP